MYNKRGEKRARELAKTIIARIILITNSEQFSKSTDAVLLVEGTTDEAFINRLNIENVRCIPITGVKTAEEALKDNSDSYRQEKQNNKKRSYAKQDVENTVKVLNDQYKNRMKSYGLVDKDFEAPFKTEHIFVTPTHDLETLLLSTDKTIFKTPEHIQESLKISLYIAYLIGSVENFLRINGHRYKKLTSDDYEKIIAKSKINLSELTDLTDLIDLEKLVDLSIEGSDKSGIKRKIAQSGILDIEIDGICDKDLYDIANGHDILDIMEFLCASQIKEFVESYKKHECRYKEFAVIHMYDLNAFKSCPLYKDMKKSGLIPIAV